MGHRHYQDKDIVYSVESCGTVNNPGLRYVLFLQGCLMRCLRCYNRDIWDSHTNKCQEMTAKQVMRQVVPYRHYLEVTGGGVTAAGGGPLSQCEFVRDWFIVRHEHGIHTCFDTNDCALHYGPILEDLLGHTNLVMLDLRQTDSEIHKTLVGIPDTKTLNFVRHPAERGQFTRVRYVIAPGYIDDERSAYLLGGFIGDIEGADVVELLPYRELGAHKQTLCSDEYKLKSVHPPLKEVVLKIKEILEGYGKSIIY